MIFIFENFSWLFVIFFFVLGAIIGSFLNVVIYRLGAGKGLSGRSQCMSCGKTLSVPELIPVVSFLFLRGRCSACGTKISFQYPLVEFFSALAFLFVFLKVGSAFLISPSLFIFIGKASIALLATSILIAIFVYDIRHKIIPPQLVFPLIGLSVLAASFKFYAGFEGVFTSKLAFDLLAGPLFYLFFYTLWKVSDGTWLGLGDGNLALAIGLFLGFAPGLSALILSFWIGAVIGLLLILLSKVLPRVSLKAGNLAITMKSEIPFAPFLIIGLALVYFFNIDVFSFF